MTREPKEQPSSLQEWKQATARDIVMELERLAVAFPRADMDARKWSVLFETFFEDLQGLSIEAIRGGCRRYRRNPENRFFPSPGQLLEACKNPFDVSGPPRRYDPLPELPPIGECVSPERMRDDIAKAGLGDRKERSLVALKDEILARPRLPYVETPEDVKRARAEALQRRLQSVDFYGKSAE